MESVNFNPKRALQITRLLYFAMIAGLVFFLIVVLSIISNPILNIDFDNPLFLTLFILTITTIPFGYFASKKYFNRIEANDSLRNKYSVYQLGFIIRLAACEGIALLSIIILLITGNLFSLLFTIISLAVLISYFPTPEKIGNDLQLTESETEQFLPGRIL